MLIPSFFSTETLPPFIRSGVTFIFSLVVVAAVGNLSILDIIFVFSAEMSAAWRTERPPLLESSGDAGDASIGTSSGKGAFTHLTDLSFNEAAVSSILLFSPESSSKTIFSSTPSSPF